MPALLIVLAAAAVATRTLAADVRDAVIVERDVRYVTRGARNLKLDIYRPRNPPTARPVVLSFHGGGWVSGSKDDGVYAAEEHRQNGPFLHFMQVLLDGGLAIVSVDYRLAREAPAPAAVDDCRTALRWVRANGSAHGLDAARIVTMGASAGGHLALMVALGEDASAAGVSGAVDLYGITDVEDVVQGPNARPWAQQWIPEGRDRIRLARELSPLRHVHRGVPPVLIVHGDRDPEVPYAQAVALRDRLAAVGASVEFVTVAGGGHGVFDQQGKALVGKRFEAFFARVGMLGR